MSSSNAATISFIPMTPTERDDKEYNFCSQKCLDGFFRDRIQFKAIVREFNKEDKKEKGK
jgi:hypothetical protein